MCGRARTGSAGADGVRPAREATGRPRAGRDPHAFQLVADRARAPAARRLPASTRDHPGLQPAGPKLVRESGRIGRPALEGGDMLRRSHILTTAALLAVCATPASAATYEELQSDGAAGGDVAPPPSSIVASAADEYQDLRSPDTVDAAEHRGLHEADGQHALNRDYQPGRGRRGPGPAVRASRHACEARPLHGLGAQAGRVARGGDGAPRRPRDTRDTHGCRGP